MVPYSTNCGNGCTEIASQGDEAHLARKSLASNYLRSPLGPFWTWELAGSFVMICKGSPSRGFVVLARIGPGVVKSPIQTSRRVRRSPQEWPVRQLVRGKRGHKQGSEPDG